MSTARVLAPAFEDEIAVVPPFLGQMITPS
jgi:hypothetical protein